ncbi:MAG: RbsD/FucU family protein [Fusobacteriaceae bacterium]
MLKNIPSNLSPELLKTICEMGHGDEIVIADGNFPGASSTKKLINCIGQNIPEILDSILKFFPLDEYVEKPLAVMEAENSIPDIWEKYKNIVKKYEKEEFLNFEKVERFKFYERSKNAYAIIMTSESSLYANIILKKGVIK